MVEATKNGVEWINVAKGIGVIIGHYDYHP